MFLTRRMAALAAIGAAAALGLSGCSGNADAGSAAAPVHILIDAPLTGGIAFPQPVDGAKAAAAAINKKGGIGGHRVVIDVCDNQGDPNGGSNCARKAVQSKVLAVAGSFDIGGAQAALPILQAARIPWIGGVSTAIQELSNPISFQFDGGTSIGEFATVAQAKAVGCTKVVNFSPGGPAAALDPQLLAAYKKAGIAMSTVVAPAGTANMTSYVSQALASHPDCVQAGGPGTDSARLIAALHQQGSTAKVFTTTGSLSPQLLASQGSVADGVYASSTTLLGDSTDPLVARYRKDMVASMGEKDAAMNLDEFSQDGWSSVMLVSDALAGSKDVTAANLLTSLNKLSDAKVGGSHSPIDFSTPRSSRLFPRAFNTWVRYFVAKDGAYTDPDGQWHDISSYLP